MIKKFEEFIVERYGNLVCNKINESFQSNKLREIIKQHGKPKYSWDNDNKLLYDIKDDEIIDVLDSRDEYWEKEYDTDEETFFIELKDGAVIVISNLGILRDAWEDITNSYNKKDEIFKKRHSERHKGNLGNSGDDIHKKHMENVDKIKMRRLAEKLQENVSDIIEKVESIMNDIDPSDFKIEDFEEEHDVESEITLNGEEYILTVYYECGCYDNYKSHGVEYCDVVYGLKYFEIYDTEDEICITNEDLGVTNDTNKHLFSEFERRLELGVYDHYEAYGLKETDFF